MLTRRMQLIDKYILTIVNSLKEKHIKTMLLTKAKTGSFGKIPSLVDWKIDVLKNFGIDFSWSSLAYNQITFYEFENKKLRCFPVYKRNAIFTAEMSKGAVLESFLNKINWHPKQIVFIDDKIENLESVQAFCDKFGILFTGYHYTKMKSVEATPLNKDRADFQFKILDEQDKWLSDDEADRKRNNAYNFKKGPHNLYLLSLFKNQQLL